MLRTCEFAVALHMFIRTGTSVYSNITNDVTKVKLLKLCFGHENFLENKIVEVNKF